MIHIQNISFGFSGKEILHHISMEVQKAEFFGILGPNGSGKTTLFKVISGILPATNGVVTIDGKELADFSKKELAKKMAVLPQITSEAFSYQVKETVMLGRYAHQKGFMKSQTFEDEQIVAKVMEQTGVDAFQNRYLHELSGGERQRVFLAQALAQQPDILILDEPTNHLDLSYQKSLLDLLKKQTLEEGLTVISIFHDLNLASLYCDRLLLMDNGHVQLIGHPNEVIKEVHIKNVYQTDVHKQAHPKLAKPQMVIVPESNQVDKIEYELTEHDLFISNERIVFQSPQPLKSISSGVTGVGFGWYQTFVNRHVPHDYICDDYEEDMQHYLKQHDFDPTTTIGMMTAAPLETVSYMSLKENDCSLFIVVTASIERAVDASQSYHFDYNMAPGTIHTWIFFNGTLTDEVFIQGVVTATEAKVRALQDEEVKDQHTGTSATGTSTDSILFAATQRGEVYPFAGTITTVKKLIGKGVYKCTREAIQKYKAKRTK